MSGTIEVAFVKQFEAEVAEAYHDEQIGALLRAGAECITAITMTNTPEAIGIDRIDADLVIRPVE